MLYRPLISLVDLLLAVLLAVIGAKPHAKSSVGFGQLPWHTAASIEHSDKAAHPDAVTMLYAECGEQRFDLGNKRPALPHRALPC